MGQYRKKPVVIEAEEYTEANISRLFYWVGVNSGASKERVIYQDGDKQVYINTLEGQMKVSIGDFVIKGVNGEFYPCKPEIFAKTYEPA